MIAPPDTFKTLGKCYYFSLALNALILLTFGFLIILLFNEGSNPDFKIIFESIKKNEFIYQMVSLAIIFYFTFCLLLNLAASIVFYHNKMPTLQLPIVIANLLCFPFGTLISIFTLYVLKKINKF